MLKIEPAERFSSRVENYVRFRPSYPSQVVDVLRKECELTPDSLVADIASGTGGFMATTSEMGELVCQAVTEIVDMRHAYHAV